MAEEIKQMDAMLAIVRPNEFPKDSFSITITGIKTSDDLDLAISSLVSGYLVWVAQHNRITVEKEHEDGK